jgi:hypothetical protein
MADTFHHTVYQLLFAANCAHRDIQTAVSFLTTRVQSLNEDDWDKLKRILKYLNGTRNLKLTLRADQTKYNVHWYIDRSHQIHEDCSGETRALPPLARELCLASQIKYNATLTQRRQNLFPLRTYLQTSSGCVTLSNAKDMISTNTSSFKIT